MIAQGNLLSFDPRLIHLYSNTLQSIAVGYVVVALLFVYTSWRTQLAVVAACLVGYVAVFAIWGQMDFTIDANICEEIDRQVLSHWRDGVLWEGDNWYWDDSYHYTWILSSLNFVVTVYLGCVAGMILRMKLQDLKKVRILLFSGVASHCFGVPSSPRCAHHQAHLVYLNDLFVGWNLPFINSISLLLGRY